MDYHDYVFRGNRFVGEFEQMYRNCENPWPETESDYENLPTSSYIPTLLRSVSARSAFSLGVGTGGHLNWLSKKCPETVMLGSDISATAVRQCRERFPHLDVSVGSARDFARNPPHFDVLILREVIWYILDDIADLAEALLNCRQGSFVAVELSTYDDQNYGKEFFDGPDSLIERFPFEILELVRYHRSRQQMEGHILLWCRI